VGGKQTPRPKPDDGQGANQKGLGDEKRWMGRRRAAGVPRRRETGSRLLARTGPDGDGQRPPKNQNKSVFLERPDISARFGQWCWSAEDFVMFANSDADLEVSPITRATTRITAPGP